MHRKYTVKQLTSLATKAAKKESSGNGYYGKFKAIDWALCTDNDGSYLEIKADRTYGAKDELKDVVYLVEYI